MVLIKYTGKYVKIYFRMKITCFALRIGFALVPPCYCWARFSWTGSGVSGWVCHVRGSDTFILTVLHTTLGVDEHCDCSSPS